MNFSRLFYLLDPDLDFLNADPCGSGSATLITSVAFVVLPTPREKLLSTLRKRLRLASAAFKDFLF